VIVKEGYDIQGAKSEGRTQNDQRLLQERRTGLIGLTWIAQAMPRAVADAHKKDNGIAQLRFRPNARHFEAPTQTH